MSSSHSRDAFRELLAAAAAAHVATNLPAPGPHVADDDVLLERWSAGYLDSAESRRLTDHLAACPRCATLVAQMVKSGVLVPPLVEEHGAERPLASPAGADGARNRSPRAFMAIAALAIAASLTAAVLYFGGRSNSPESQLALVRADLARGAHLEAWQRSEGLLRREGTERLRGEVLSVASEAAEKAAVERLEQGDFVQVGRIAKRADQLGVSTDQLLNAELQAGRGEAAVVSLARVGALVDYGYDLRGQAFQKGFPTFDAAFEQQRKQWEDAVQKHPESALLRVNYGQFLLKAGAIAAAETQFTTALQRHPSSIDAQLGLGLARYERQDYAGALDAFQAVLRERPQSAAATMNAALASDASGRKEDARRYWRQAVPLVSDPALREQIERRLQDQGEN